MAETVSCYRAEKEILRPHSKGMWPYARDNGKIGKIFNKDFAELIID